MRGNTVTAPSGGRTPRRWTLAAWAAAGVVTVGLAVIWAMHARDAVVVRVDVGAQRLEVRRGGRVVAVYPVSTSSFGTGDEPGSNRTPLGWMRVEAKIGAGAPLGAEFVNRAWTGRVIEPDQPGKGGDRILTRILWLRGLEPRNRNAQRRGIYIHGTNQERLVGRPASRGCIRMRNRDVAELFDLVRVGTRVECVGARAKRD